MKKIYSFFVAAMFATASFAQQAVANFGTDAVTEVQDGKYYVLHKTGVSNGGVHYLYSNLAGEGIFATTERTDELKYVWKATKDTDGKVSFQNVATGGYMASLLTAIGSGDGGVLLKTTVNMTDAAKLTPEVMGTTFNFSQERPAEADASVVTREKYYLNCNPGAATVWYTSGGNSDYSLYEVTITGNVQTVDLVVNDTYNGQETATRGTSPYAVGHVIASPTTALPLGLSRTMSFGGVAVEGDSYTVTTAGTLSLNIVQDFSSLPFTPSTNFNDLKWYNITIRGNKVWTVEGDAANAVANGDTSADAAQWAIVPTDNILTKGWYIVNKTAPNKVLLLATNSDGGISEATAATLVEKDVAGEKQWTIQASEDKYVFRQLNDKTADAYLNDHANGGVLKTWVSASGANDAGSQVTFTPVESSSIQGAKVADEAETVYFDLNGRKVSKLVSGKVYISNKGVKVFVK